MWAHLHSDGFRKRLALVSLTIQNTVVILLTRYTRARTGDMYFASTAVVMSELVKLVTCFVLVFGEESFSITALGQNLKNNILLDPWDCVLISVPGVVYTIQNNLLFVGYTYLSAVSFQNGTTISNKEERIDRLAEYFEQQLSWPPAVTHPEPTGEVEPWTVNVEPHTASEVYDCVSYQLKIFTAAIFFRIILKRQLSRTQWFALFLLFAGVSLTQVSDASNAGRSDSAATVWEQMLALSSVLLACTCSGFAGVYFEKLLKGSRKSVAVRNIQLSFYGITAGILTVLIKDGASVRQRGFFFGYDSIVWVSIFTQALGGLLIAATIRYADNILKGFAPSVAIVLNFILSMFFFGFHPTVMFVAGAILVIVATVLYSLCPPPQLVGKEPKSTPSDAVQQV
ncbi:hypothetical protein T265_01223 [Opisthorchis viverrini]|uniref:UDP-galactose transporter n=1 Tax=Opisthorchis viverrini TaxID=6198 RepID=A0A075AJ43_OPIVI|nr:hypothetical protein T265_01223 [Opisthorchis viverrini]KER32734.1 hypothetical protein T265_01223 [Opisthorchis viverrini]